MTWFSSTGEYSISPKETLVYGEPEITCGSKKDDSDSDPKPKPKPDSDPPSSSGTSGTSGTPGPSGSGAWDDFQHERERIIISSTNSHSR